MEETETIDCLKNTKTLLSKIVKSNSLPPDLEIEACNLLYDLLTLFSKLQEPASSEKEGDPLIEAKKDLYFSI